MEPKQRRRACHRVTDGTPCPVCGAVHHPVLAVPCAGETTKEEPDALRKKLQDLRQEQSRAEQTAAAAKARHEVAFAQSNAANDAAKSITESEEVLTAAYIAAQTALNEAQKLSAAQALLHTRNLRHQSERSAYAGRKPPQRRACRLPRRFEERAAN